MGKTNVIVLNPDMTFEEKKVKTQVVQLAIDAEWKPSFSPGKSVFAELVPRFRFWRKPRRLILIEAGAKKAYELEVEGNPIKGELKPIHWTYNEIKKFVAKVVAKSKAQQKPFTNWQVFALLAVGGIIIVLQILTMRGIRFV